MNHIKDIIESADHKVCYCKRVTKLKFLEFIKFHPNPKEVTKNELAKGIGMATSCGRCMLPDLKNKKYDVYYKELIK